MVNRYQTLFFVSLLGFFSSTILAQEKFIKWHSTNAQLLRGYDFELGAGQRTVLTLEHANDWTYGDFFIFGDHIWPDNGDSTYYFEPTLRFSLSKIMGQPISFGALKDVLISTQIEKPKHQSARKLAGLAFDFDVPGMTFFKTHLYVRDNPDLSGSTYQVTLVWNIPLQFNNTHILVEGFTDIAGSEGTTVSHQLIVPRLLVDASALVGAKPKKLWAGIEWQYWHNKFGVDGVTESVPQFQIKYIF